MHLLAVTQSYVYANTTAQAANQIIRRQQTSHPDLYVSDATTEIYLEIRTQIRQGQRISKTQANGTTTDPANPAESAIGGPRGMNPGKEKRLEP